MMASITSVDASESIVVNSKLYPYPSYDGVIVMGEIINNFTYAVSKVNFSITFYDEGAHVLKKAYSLASLEVIPPSRRASFQYPFKNEEIENFKYYDVNVSSYMASEPKPTGFSITPNVPAVILNVSDTKVRGVVTNTIADTVKLINILALLYDQDGFIGTTDSDLTNVVLEPGATGPFCCFTSIINSTFNVTRCIITGESQSYGVAEEVVITSTKNQNGGFNYMIAVAIIIGVGAFVSSFIFLRRGYRKRKRNIRSRLSRKHSTSRISKHLNSLANYDEVNNIAASV
jgi:hypothetical protein